MTFLPYALLLTLLSASQAGIQETSSKNNKEARIIHTAESSENSESEDTKKEDGSEDNDETILVSDPNDESERRVESDDEGTTLQARYKTLDNELGDYLVKGQPAIF